MRFGPLLILHLLVLAVTLGLRPLMPVDETRYLAVAWAMWVEGEWLVPHLNGEPYSHKPPLLFWLIHLGWAIFGVNELWPRLIGPAFALASLGLMLRVARQLWPMQPKVGTVAVLLLASSIYWLGFSTAVMFDMPVVFFVLLGVWGLLELEQGRTRGWWALFFAVALGGLMKGPFPILYLAFITLAAPLWMQLTDVWWRWYLRAAAVGLAGVVVVFAWAIPAALHGGERYASEILWGQVAGRAVDAFDHARPLGWYLPVLLLMLLPLPLWKGVWQALWPWSRRLSERRALLWGWGVGPFVLLSIVSGKQPHYLLPMLPGIALFVARGLVELGEDRSRAWAVGGFWILLGAGLLLFPWFERSQWAGPLQGVNVLWALVPLGLGWLSLRARPWFEQLRWMMLSSTLAFLALLLYAQPLRSYFDLSPFARELRQLEGEHPLAMVGEYRGEFQFLGRLSHPLTVLMNPEQARTWCQEHPSGMVLVMHPSGPEPFGAWATTRYRSKWMAVWPCDRLEAAWP